jgi:hypothetical protein
MINVRSTRGVKCKSDYNEGKVEKFSSWSINDVKFGTSCRRIGNWTGAGVTATLG